MASQTVLFFILLSAVYFPLLATSKGGFSTELIHRDSPQSPFYNPNLTPSDLLRASIERTISRFNQIITTKDDIDSTITPAGAEYLMSVNIGTPPFNVMAIADTGSDLTWTQCKPCLSCYPQKAPIYDSSKSSTYTSLSCNSQSCSQLPIGDCDTRSKCQYTYTYGDQSHTIGVLSTETFSIGSASIPKLLFGCSHDSNGTFDSSSAGIVGLGGGPLSLVSQLGSSIDHKFSYCLVPSDSNRTSKINFGENADVGTKALTTPLVKGLSNTYYTVTLESVSVAGGEKIAVRSKADDYEQEGNIIVDSGTTLTILDDSVLNKLTDEVSKVVTYPTKQDPQGLFALCYDVSGVNRDGVGFPDLSFQFTDAALTLKPLNAFVEVEDNVWCLAMVSTAQLGGGGVQIFGNIAQQNFHVGYDLKNQRLSFAPADCSKF